MTGQAFGQQGRRAGGKGLPGWRGITNHAARPGLWVDGHQALLVFLGLGVLVGAVEHEKVQTGVTAHTKLTDQILYSVGSVGGNSPNTGVGLGVPLLLFRAVRFLDRSRHLTVETATVSAKVQQRNTSIGTSGGVGLQLLAEM